MKKSLMVFLVFMVLLSSFVFVPVQKANALGLDTVVKLVGGKAIVRGLAEEVGMQLSKKQLDNVVSVIEQKTFEGDSKAIDFVNKANSVTASEVPTKSAFKKFILDPAVWLTGIDLIFAAIDAFKTGYDTSAPVPIYGKQCNAVSLGNFVANDPYSAYLEVFIGGQRFLASGVVGSTYAGTVTNKTTVVLKSSVYMGYSTPLSSYYYNIYVDVFDDGVLKQSNAKKDVKVGFQTDVTLTDGQCSVPVVSTDVVDTSPITYYNYFYNDTYNTNTTYNVEMDIPDTVNFDDTTPWNDPDPRIGTEVTPPTDTDNDGIPDTTDSTPDKPGDGSDGTNPFASLVPILFLIKLFGLLGSVLSYFGRMLAFVMTIPIIPSKTIDNEAFQWFRDADIIGIHIYTVVSSLASIGLSFLVYRAVRRLF